MAYRDTDIFDKAGDVLLFDIGKQQIIFEKGHVWAAGVCNEPTVNWPQKFQNVTTVCLTL